MIATAEIDIVGSWLEIGMTIAAIAAGVFTFLVPYMKRKYVGRRRTTEKKDVSYPKSFQWDIHTRLHETLTELRVKTDCARTQIVQFHNTGNFIDGISMKKFSVTHESLGIGVSGEGEYKKDLLVTMFLEQLTLLKQDEPILHFTDSMKESYSKRYLQNSNVIAFSTLPIRKKREIVGYVMLEWCSENKVADIDIEYMKEVFEESRTHVEVQLDQQLKIYD
tara:strand:- start:475 stop:1137 length:663 start_codon:yes stop_codon:yes gene_type:complete